MQNLWSLSYTKNEVIEEEQDDYDDNQNFETLKLKLHNQGQEQFVQGRDKVQQNPDNLTNEEKFEMFLKNKCRAQI